MNNSSCGRNSSSSFIYSLFFLFCCRFSNKFPPSCLFFIGVTTCLRISQGTSLMAQWLGICLPVQGTWVWYLAQENPICHRATQPMFRNYWDCAPQQRLLQSEACTAQWRVAPTSHNKRNPRHSHNQKIKWKWKLKIIIFQKKRIS